MSVLRIDFKLNDEPAVFEGPPMTRLIDVLREHNRVTGTKEGCGEGECGACTILVDGAAVNSCLIPVIQAAGAQIVTVEGLARDAALHPVQQAFLDHGGAQCGICTPGFLLAAAALLERESNPTEIQVREALAGNLCRCTGYQKIVDSVVRAMAPGDAKC